MNKIDRQLCIQNIHTLRNYRVISWEESRGERYRDIDRES